MAHGDARERKLKGRCRMQWVASTLHTTSEQRVYGLFSNVNRSPVNVFITTMNSSVAEASTCTVKYFNRLMPNDTYMGRTALLTSKRCILYIYSTHLGTEYFKHALYFPFFPLQNAVCFIMVTCLVPVLFTFYIQGVLKFKK